MITVPWKLIRFAMVGTVGFAVDAGMLTLLINHVCWSAWQARLLSFPSALLVTWLLNRRYTFARRVNQRVSSEAVGYALIQSIGALLNFAVFSLLLYFVAPLRPMPIIPLAFGSLAGLLFNFTASDRLLYRRNGV